MNGASKWGEQSEWAVQANERSEWLSGPFKKWLLQVETDPYRGPRHATPEVCPGGPNYNVNVNFMMKFLVGLATNPYKRLCWMSGQLLLPVGLTPMNRKRQMDSSTYHTSEPTLYLLIHILIISIRGIMTEGAFLVWDNRVLNGPLGSSLHSFARTALWTVTGKKSNITKMNSSTLSDTPPKFLQTSANVRQVVGNWMCALKAYAKYYLR